FSCDQFQAGLDMARRSKIFTSAALALILAAESRDCRATMQRKESYKPNPTMSPEAVLSELQRSVVQRDLRNARLSEENLDLWLKLYPVVRLRPRSYRKSSGYYRGIFNSQKKIIARWEGEESIPPTDSFGDWHSYDPGGTDRRSYCESFSL